MKVGTLEKQEKGAASCTMKFHNLTIRLVYGQLDVHGLRFCILTKVRSS